MSKFICLTAISTAVISVLSPGVAIAQNVFIQGSPDNGYSSTTIYIPSTNTTTTTVNRVNSDTYPGGNSVTTSTTTTSTGSSFRNRRQHGQSTIIFRNGNPRNVQVNCTTSVIGSPIPSPVALNSVTGGLCR